MHWIENLVIRLHLIPFSHHKSRSSPIAFDIVLMSALCGRHQTNIGPTLGRHSLLSGLNLGAVTQWIRCWTGMRIVAGSNPATAWRNWADPPWTTASLHPGANGYLAKGSNGNCRVCADYGTRLYTPQGIEIGSCLNRPAKGVIVKSFKAGWVVYLTVNLYIYNF